MSEKIIVVVDDNSFNLNMCKKALKDLYKVYLVPSAENMFTLLEKVHPDLILLDVEMPGIHGYEAMRMLKKNETYANIPVIFLSAMDDDQSEIEGLELGAVDYIHKPFVSSLLIKRIDTQLKLSSERGETSICKETIASLIKPMKAIIDTIETSLQSDDIKQIKELLMKAKEETKAVIEQISNQH